MAAWEIFFLAFAGGMFGGAGATAAILWFAEYT